MLTGYKRGNKMYVEAFAAKLKKARQDTGFTQREIAKKLKISKSTILFTFFLDYFYPWG